MPDHSKPKNGRNGTKSVMVYEENSKATPDQTTFSAAEIGAGVSTSFDSDDGLEMVPVKVMGGITPWNRSSTSVTEEESVEDETRPSNERLLITAFISFMSFTILQSVAAVFAGSEAMMGDSAAMGIDALTYLFNLIAERRKGRFEEYYHKTYSFASLPKDPARRKRFKERLKRKMTLRMELIPPIVSVTTLIFVTGIVLRGSIHMLRLDAHRDRTEQGDPNVNLMLIFSSLNLLLDIVNVLCFARAKRLFGYETIPKHTVPGEILRTGSNGSSGSRSPIQTTRMEYAQLGNNFSDDDNESDDFFEEALRQPDDDPETFDEEENGGSDGESNDTEPMSNRTTTNGNGHHHDDDEEETGIQEEANLNMCSAYTHVFADTLRSLAVIAASIIAEVANGVTSEEADAMAAVVVSGLILVSLLPLMSGLWATFQELRTIRAEERDDQLLASENCKSATTSLS